MAVSFLAPTAACVLTATSQARVWGYVWLGVTAPDDASASAAFYNGSANTDPFLWSLAASPCMSTPMAGPFKVSTSLLHVDLDGANACALIATASY